MLWFVIALVVGISVGALVLWLHSRDIKVAWYECLIGAIGLLILLFALQNFLGSLSEWQTTAAYMFLLVTGVPAVILIAVAASLIWRRQRAAG